MPTYIDWMRSCWYITLTACPAISVPGGFTASGLPVGLQIVGRHRGDWSVLQMAHGFERVTQFGGRKPDLAALVVAEAWGPAPFSLSCSSASPSSIPFRESGFGAAIRACGPGGGVLAYPVRSLLRFPGTGRITPAQRAPHISGVLCAGPTRGALCVHQRRHVRRPGGDTVENRRAKIPLGGISQEQVSAVLGKPGVCSRCATLGGAEMAGPPARRCAFPQARGRRVRLLLPDLVVADAEVSEIDERIAEMRAGSAQFIGADVTVQVFVPGCPSTEFWLTTSS